MFSEIKKWRYKRKLSQCLKDQTVSGKLSWTKRRVDSFQATTTQLAFLVSREERMMCEPVCSLRIYEMKEDEAGDRYCNPNTLIETYYDVDSLFWYVKKTFDTPRERHKMQLLDEYLNVCQKKEETKSWDLTTEI